MPMRRHQTLLRAATAVPPTRAHSWNGVADDGFRRSRDMSRCVLRATDGGGSLRGKGGM